MDLFIHTNLFLSEDIEDEYEVIERAVEVAEEQGLDGIEIGSMHLKPRLDDEKKSKIMELLDDYSGDLILGAHHRGHGSMCDSQSLNRRNRWIGKMGDIAEEIGALYVVTTADPVPKGHSKQRGLNSLKVSLREVYTNFSGKNPIFTIENDVRMYNNSDPEDIEFENVINTFEDVKEVSENLSDFKMTFDPCNAFLAGEEPKEFLETIAGYTEHVHIKDGSRKEEGYELKAIGEGDVDYEAILPLIQETVDTVTIEYPGGAPRGYVSGYVERSRNYLEEKGLET